MTIKPLAPSVKVTIVPVTAFQQNAHLLVCVASNRAALVDPGGEPDRLLDAVEQSGAHLEKILVTHAHIDHAGSVAEIAERAGVPVEGPHKDDRFWIERMEQDGRDWGLPHARPFTPTRWLKDGDIVTVGEASFDVVHTPGHTPGHVVFIQKESRLACVGDVLFKGSVGRSDFPKGDFPTLVASITEKLWPYGDDIAFIPGHGPMSTFGDERRSNPFVGDAALS